MGWVTAATRERPPRCQGMPWPNTSAIFSGVFGRALARANWPPNVEPMSSPHSLSRRDALKTLGAGAALLGVGAFSANTTAAESTPAAAAGTRQPFMLPPLAYDYGALEPHFDARTMEIHHKRHHQAYIDNATRALAD